MPKLARNGHNLSHYRLFTHDMGYLVPVGLVEVLPGDQFNHSSRALMRVQPLLKPVMHPVDVRIHHYFVPNRIVWPDWDAFITRRDSGLTIPTITLTNQARGSLADHLGVPCDGATDYTVNELPFRVYNAIYNEYYRDQNLIAEVAEDSTVLQRVAWEKDYFTTARAEPQFGTASIDIPFAAGTTAPVTGIWASEASAGTVAQASAHRDSTGALIPDTNQNIFPTNASGMAIKMTGTGNVGATNFPDVHADLSQISGGGININEFREAMSMQKFLEHRNRYGSRHEDYLRFLGIRPSDARLQNPEYLGGGRNVISFSEVLSTADTATFNIGDLAGHGIAAVSSRPYRRFFEESGFVMSLMSVRPRTMYSQALHRMWLRSTCFDFWQKELEGMGPQEIFVKELYALHANATDVFGYNGRHDEYRHHPSYVSGEFRDGGTEEDWHYARDFTTSPALNQTFTDCLPSDRMYADTATPELYTMVTHNLRATRGVAQVARH